MLVPSTKESSMSDLRRLFLSLFAAAILAACLAIPSFGAEASSGSVRHTIAGAHVAIYNLVGTLEVVRGDGPSVVAEVTTKGEDAGQLKVASGAIDGVQTFRIIYPGDRILVREFGDHTTSTFRVREDGTFGGKDRTGRKVVLTGHGSGIEAAADVRIRIPAGKKVDIYWGHGRGSVTRVEADLSLDAAAMPVSVTGIKGQLHVDVGSGEVKIDDATGDVTVDTGSGEVSLSGIRAGSIDVDTGSGEVTGTHLTSTTLSIDTGSGEIQVTGLKVQRVSLETGSGEVVAELSEGVQSVEIESGSGDVSVTIPKKFGAQLSVETGSGGIETNLTMETSVRKHDELVGRIGDGRGQISIETGSGTVSIRQAGL
jgi:hypothetical protein